MLRSGYSYAKPYLKVSLHSRRYVTPHPGTLLIAQAQYHLTSFFLSLVDASQFIGLGIAYTIKYLLDQHYTVSHLVKHALVMSCCYFLIALIPLIGPAISLHFPFILLISFFLFGFLQFAFQPTLSREMRKYYTR